jgi:hypothetical protein
MNHLEKLDLMELVESDKYHIIQFLLAHNIRVKEGEINLLYSEGEGEPYLNLWELQVEPHLVTANFMIERPQDLNSNITGILENLIDKITTRGWPDNPYDPVAYTQQLDNVCPHFKSIKIDEQPNGINIILIGGICYCS